MKSFGINEFEENKKILNIKDRDMLLVDDPNIYNEKTIKSIKDKISAVVYKITPTKKTINELMLNFIPASGLEIVEMGDFAYARKEEIDRRLEKKTILNKIIEDYKESRK